MSKKFNKILILIIAAIALVGFFALIVNNYKTKTSFKYAEKTAEELEPDQNSQDAVSKAVIEDASQDKDTRVIQSELINIKSDDIVLGDINAPVTMIEYASLSCPHCAAFSREAFEKVKEDYIDKGKVKFVFRNFPLNQPALVATMFASCQAKDNKSELPNKYFDTIKVLFRTQDSWAFDKDFEKKLEAIASLDGMDQKRFQSCINDQKLQEKILSDRMEASKTLQLRSTPSFFINGEVSEGYIDYLTIKKVIDKKLATIQQ